VIPEARLLRVRHRQARHENDRSRELKRTDWFPFSNELSADSYVELVTHEDGAAHLGVWAAILMVASKAKPRGVLVRDDGRPHNAASLARVTRLPESVTASAIDRLLKIKLLEVVDDDPHAHGPITIELLTVIRADLEATQVTFGEYLAEIRKRAGNEWRNPAGFLRSMSKRFRSKARPASDPITAAEEQEKNYKCPICFSAVPGEGVRLVGGKIEVCECATPAYAAQFQARALLKEKTLQ